MSDDDRIQIEEQWDAWGIRRYVDGKLMSSEPWKPLYPIVPFFIVPFFMLEVNK